MTEQEIAKSIVSTEQAKPAKPYGMSDLAREFPQLVSRSGKVKRSTLKKKYTLREAMKQVSRFRDMMDSLAELDEPLKLCFFTLNGTLTIEGPAADFIASIQDFSIDLIEAGWQFTAC